MKSEKEYLDRIRYLYMMKLNKMKLGLDNEKDFATIYYKNKDKWQNNVGIK